MKKLTNKKFTLNLLIISFLTLLTVYLLVNFILFKNDSALLFIRFTTMLGTIIMILTLIVYIIIFLVRLALRKKDCFGRSLSIISAITIVLTLSTVILIKEESKYYHAINMNWEINLPRKYEELYYKDSGPSFNGDGERYCIFQYENLDEISNAVEWTTKDNNMEIDITEVLKILNVPKENYPNFNNYCKYYYKIKEDHSKLYMVLNSNSKKIYITENIF